MDRRGPTGSLCQVQPSVSGDLTNWKLIAAAMPAAVVRRTHDDVSGLPAPGLEASARQYRRCRLRSLRPATAGEDVPANSLPPCSGLTFFRRRHRLSLGV